MGELDSPNMTIEARAIELVIAFEKRRNKGEIKVERGGRGDGYDLRITNNKGEVLRLIEVKGCRGPNWPNGRYLQPSEHRNAQNRDGEFYVYVVKLEPEPSEIAVIPSQTILDKSKQRIRYRFSLKKGEWKDFIVKD